MYLRGIGGRTSPDSLAGLPGLEQQSRDKPPKLSAPKSMTPKPANLAAILHAFWRLNVNEPAQRRKQMRSPILGLVVILAAVVLWSSAEAGPKKEKGKPEMEIRIIIPDKTGSLKDDLLVRSYIELVNTSDKEIRINYSTDPLEHLDLRVFSPMGVQIGKGTWISPSAPGIRHELALLPRKSYKASIWLFGTTPSEDRMVPGIYRFVAVFNYDSKQFESKSATLKVTD